MDPHQYKFPEGEHFSQENRDRLEAFRRSPEKQPAGPFELVQRAARTQYDRRDIAVAIEQKNGRTVTIPFINLQFNLPPRPKEVIYKYLIEQERAIAGRVFEGGEQGGYMFWLDHKGSSIISNDVSDWHFEMPNPYDPKNPYGVHIESTSHELKKFHKDGKSYPVTIQDIERFIPAVYYHMHETAVLYPFDQNFDDVITDIELPNNVTPMFPRKQAASEEIDDKLAA